uniref:RNase H type-1 domain-containing protein n=1 Tax=Cannabis sativa TaxID=3483 RepID=A0A803P5W8_CANSA
MRLLSYAGRLTLIKNVATAMPVYMMSTNKIPISTCRELDAVIRKYWWQGNLDKDRFMALRSWDKICQPKGSGGLGIRRFEDFNRALITKLAWSVGQGIKSKGYTARTLADLSIGNGWNKEVVLQIFGDLGERILEIPRLPLSHKDRIIWKEKQNGVFSVKSAYVVDQGERDESLDGIEVPLEDRTEKVDWMRILDGKRVICTDASWLKDEAGLATVMRMKNAECWAYKSTRIKVYSALQAQLEAILLALQWALKEQWEEHCVLSNYFQVIQALRNKQCPSNWKTFNVSFAILDSSKKFVSCEFFYISRNLNVAADGLAKNARVTSNFPILIQREGNPPVLPIFLSV